ncbi:MAG: threonine aldolase, partial [Mediterranea sp.]|nr:threonine aldolase [Mediterranea sp.]
MRSFASDNNSGVHPLVMEALERANRDHAVGYGDDAWTAEAAGRLKECFGQECEPLFVFNGTGSNAIALQLATRPYHLILCAETAHIYVDECGAPARMTGCQLRPIATADGKLTPELLRPHLKNFGEQHHSQPGVVYISQCTELGTIYTPEEVRLLADLIHPYGMFLHMDGARLANACAALGCELR